MKLRTLQDVEQALLPFYDVAGETTGRDITVQRMKRLMAHVGHPERRLRVVHIAGTSGKTSTSYYISALLGAADVKIGTTVSPHVDSLTERVQINGHPIGEKMFVRYMSEFLELIQDAPEMPSWFEAMMAFALWVFDKESVDYAVVETGLGGLHDASNVCVRPDKVCVITDIGLDHQQVLGSTIEQIATQKAGIVQAGNAVFMYEQPAAVMRAVRLRLSGIENVVLHTQDQPRLMKAVPKLPEIMPKFQQRNWLLAYAVYRFIAERDSLPHRDLGLAVRTANQIVPGRMQEQTYGAKTVVMDGAHNAAKMRAFVDSFRSKYGVRSVPVLLAVKDNKDVPGLVRELTPIASEIIITTFQVSQDYQRLHSANPDLVAAALADIQYRAVSIVFEPAEAISQLLDRSANLAVVTGSFYLLSQIRGLTLTDAGKL